VSDKHEKPCPKCGHCPTCGRSNYPVPYWPYPYYWPYGRWQPPYTSPTITWQTTSSGASSPQITLYGLTASASASN
jgi:hypothetical protein